ncbi:MAG: hemerythrin domain-containing protein, partial [Candidatus Thiodiazotropha sp. 6PLUC3]
MSTLESMKGSHSDMQQIISDLRAMMTKEQLSIRPNAMTTHKMICDLAELMNGHMSEQDRGVYPGLLT